MNDSKKLSRRELLQGLALGVAAAATLPVLSGCKKELACTDTTGLSDVDLTLRNAQAYVDKAPDPAKSCSGCALFNAPGAPNTCGSCKLIKGPVNPAGWCKAWVQKTT
jgi:hypothetical protein